MTQVPDFKEKKIKIKKCNGNGATQDIIKDTKRISKIYFMLDYILNNHRCTVSEIMKELNLCSSTLYNCIDKIFEIGLIDKEPSSGRNKNEAHFNLIAKH